MYDFWNISHQLCWIWWISWEINCRCVGLQCSLASFWLILSLYRIRSQSFVGCFVLLVVIPNTGYKYITFGRVLCPPILAYELLLTHISPSRTERAEPDHIRSLTCNEWRMDVNSDRVFYSQYGVYWTNVFECDKCCDRARQKESIKIREN